jgi:hypothetical protein
MWCDVMWCDVMWCDSIRYDKIWYDVWYDMIRYDMICDVRWCDVMWCNGMRCDAIRYDTIYDVWYDMIRYDMMWCDAMGCDAIRYDMIWYDVMWCDGLRCDAMRYDMIWCMIWYDTIYDMMIWYIFKLKLGWHPVAVVQYTFTHKQYAEQHNETECLERNVTYKLEHWYVRHNNVYCLLLWATCFNVRSPYRIRHHLKVNTAILTFTLIDKHKYHM